MSVNSLSELDRARLIKGLKQRRLNKDALLIELLLRSGMRSEELVKVNFKEDVNETTNTILIHAAKGSNDRIIPLDKSFTRAILTVFPSGALELGCKPESFKRHLRRVWDKLKLEILGFGYGHVTLHGLRASFAMAIYENVDHDILLTKELLGHRSMDSTMHYVAQSRTASKASKIRSAI